MSLKTATDFIFNLRKTKLKLDKNSRIFLSQLWNYHGILKTPIEQSTLSKIFKQIKIIE